MQKYTASVITAGCLWGLMGLFTRTLATYGVDSTGAIVLRCGIAALLFAVTLLVRDSKQFRIRLKDIWCFIGTGICSLLFFTYCYFQAITIMDLSTAAVLLYTAPSIVMILSLILFHERITVQKLIALVLAFAGCCLVSLVGGEHKLSRRSSPRSAFSTASARASAMRSTASSPATRSTAAIRATPSTFIPAC